MSSKADQVSRSAEGDTNEDKTSKNARKWHNVPNSHTTDFLKTGKKWEGN